MRRGAKMAGITSRRRIAALAAPWEEEPLASAREKPDALRLQAHVESLQQIIADQERRIETLETERAHRIEVEDVHRELDRFNLPRRTPGGIRYFIGERFALLKARIEVETS